MHKYGEVPFQCPFNFFSPCVASILNQPPYCSVDTFTYMQNFFHHCWSLKVQYSTSHTQSHQYVCHMLYTWVKEKQITGNIINQMSIFNNSTVQRCVYIHTTYGADNTTWHEIGRVDCWEHTEQQHWMIMSSNQWHLLIKVTPPTIQQGPLGDKWTKVLRVILAPLNAHVIRSH